MKIQHKSCHRDKRAAEYPSIEDQLDSLWHAMDQGVIDKVEPMYSQIKAVKDKYPKSTQVN